MLYIIPWSADSGICVTDNIIQVLLLENIITGSLSILLLVCDVLMMSDNFVEKFITKNSETSEIN
jgi:hypothetical protein